jgi:glycosyltransferase involved in cell wall biosynthesis
MRIAIVAEGFVPIPPKKYGGTERVIYYLIKGLLEKGHEVKLLAPGDSEVDCELIPICEKHTFFGRNDEEQEIIKKRIEKIRINTKKILFKILPDVDIIHSHGFDIKDFSEIPHVITLHNMFEFENMDFFEERKDLNYITVSKNQQEPMPHLNYAGVVYNGQDPLEFEFNNNPGDYLCFIGRFDMDKKPHEAIQLALKLNKKIKLAGKLDYKGRKYFKEEIEPYLDNPLVEYLGEIGMEEKVKLLKGALCNIHPTNFREPFGLTVIEAAYCGTPTIAIRRGAMPEIIEHGRTGLVVEDFNEGYHHIHKCFEMDRTYISTRARMLFNYKIMTEEYLKIYERIINKKYTLETTADSVRKTLLLGNGDYANPMWKH